MKFEVLGKQYDYLQAIHKSKLSDLYELKVAAGIGPRAIMALFSRIDAANTPDEIADVMEEAESLMAFAGLVFLCRRSVGDKVSFEDSQVSYADIGWAPEPGDMDTVEADPTEASGGQSQPDAETPTVPESKRKRPSEPTS